VNWANEERWTTLCRTAGLGKIDPKWYQCLTEAYAEPKRHYHNQRHIAKCLAEFDQACHLAQQASAVELALWFHDAVYDPRAADNEERSAALAERCLLENGMPVAPVEKVVKLIMATKHHGTNLNIDAGLIVDIDLSILGRDEKRFFEYENEIREEYAWVPENIFVPKRAEILEGFLSRGQIYATNLFRGKYERQARKNLAASLRHLKQRAGNI
jgi:predicted metal-dependent HD superfamily phosphohydrolase